MTRFWQYLRSRILLANLFVLMLSVVIVLLLTRFVFVDLLDSAIRPNLVQLSQSVHPDKAHTKIVGHNNNCDSKKQDVQLAAGQLTYYYY